MKTVHAAVSDIFTMHPELCGFSVQDAETLTRERVSGQLEAGLYLADVATTTYGSSEQLLGEISVALLELIDEDPQAVDALRGRTFARTLH
ncbi:MAG TPA: hypothetical protein VNU96_06735 [Burkholderiales bacterium]|nr:hypothetical protein [Burkholderiales bacterium]